MVKYAKLDECQLTELCQVKYFMRIVFLYFSNNSEFNVGHLLSFK